MGENGEFVKDNVDKYDDHDDDKNNCNNNDKQRSIKSIMGDHLKDTNFTPSNHYIADYKIGDQKNIRKKIEKKLDGSGLEELAKPLFLPDSNLLPELSKGFKLRVLDHDMNDILDDTIIPEDLKIELFYC